ncbi:MAG: sugar phosphate isomerase/epimerase [Oscillospiraceae bacterium]|nr:sugar phosphate isomerase/epimerase [Oscillospiraceae bacterium]
MSSVKLFSFGGELKTELSDQIEAAKRNKLNGLELGGTEFGPISDISFVAACLIRKKLNDSGLEVLSLATTIGRIGIKDDFEAQIEKLKNTLEVCRVLGAEKVRISSFFIPGFEKPEDYKQLVIDRLGRMNELAGAHGVTLCLENKSGCYGGTAERCHEILSALPEMVGVFNPAEFVKAGEDVMADWDKLRSRIAYIHVSDISEDGKPVPAGSGIAHIRDLTRRFIERGGRNFSIDPGLVVRRSNKQTEHEGHDYTYKNTDAAFDAACNGFKAIIGIRD